MMDERENRRKVRNYLLAKLMAEALKHQELLPRDTADRVMAALGEPQETRLIGMFEAMLERLPVERAVVAAVIAHKAEGQPEGSPEAEQLMEERRCMRDLVPMTNLIELG